MILTRHAFNVATDSGGDFTDTGPPIFGMVYQVSCDTGAFDTGCDFRLEAVNSRVVIAHWENAGGSAWARGPRMLTYDTGGAAVGDQPFVVAGDRLRVTVTQSEGVTGSKAGRVFVWVGG